MTDNLYKTTVKYVDFMHMAHVKYALCIRDAV